MGILERIKNKISEIKLNYKKLDLKELPSQSYFYKDDFYIKIKKITPEDKAYFLEKYDKDDLIKSLYCLKEIVNRNIKLNDNYTFDDVLSIDIVYIFMKIVKLTKGSDVIVSYKMSDDVRKYIKFGDNFNYIDIPIEIMDNYDYDKNCFNFNGWEYKLPTNGVETSIVDFFSRNFDEIFQKLSYNFMFFVGDKNKLNDSEIKNLLELFNYDISKEEIEYINNIVSIMSKFNIYSLKNDDGEEVRLYSIQLDKIWE